MYGAGQSGGCRAFPPWMEEGGTYGRDSSALSGTALDHVRVLLWG